MHTRSVRRLVMLMVGLAVVLVLPGPAAGANWPPPGIAGAWPENCQGQLDLRPVGLIPSFERTYVGCVQDRYFFEILVVPAHPDLSGYPARARRVRVFESDAVGYLTRTAEGANCGDGPVAFGLVYTGETPAFDDWPVSADGTLTAPYITGTVRRGSETLEGTYAFSDAEGNYNAGCFYSASAGWTATCVDGPGCNFRSPPCVVPKLVGRSPDAAEAVLERRHCYLGPVRFRHSVRAKRGSVVAQRPRPGTRQVNDATYRIYAVDIWIGKR